MRVAVGPFRKGNLLAEGAAGFLRKPYRLAALAATVRRALEPPRP